MDLKQWQCKNDHILGMIFLDENSIPRLMLYRRAVDLTAEEPEEVEILGPLWGSMPVKCDVCGDVVPWQISMEALAHMIRELHPHEKKLLQAHLAKGRVKKRTWQKNLAKRRAR